MDRQTIMETNRSLRNIKNELESLLEKGVIDEAAFDTISAKLPAESSFRGATSGTPRTANSSNNPTPAPPTQAFQGLTVTSQSPPQAASPAAAPSPAPPSYADTPAPNVPNRSAKPVIAQARALYHYAATDARDLSLDKDDRVEVHEYMNQDWWMGRNQRTGQEGIFPRNYVLVEHEEKQRGVPPVPAFQQPVYAQGPPPQQNPYNANVPPMAIADGGNYQQQPQQQQDGGAGSGKAGQMGKKFGKKLGNAAIFGAGATIGGNIVNSIF